MRTTKTMRRSNILALLAGGVSLFAVSSSQAADATKAALVPGGPHPYFTAWEQAGKDAAAAFKLGAADYKVPQKWELGTQNELLESLVTQGYNAFLVFPGDPVGSVSTVAELADTGAPVIALAGCSKTRQKRRSVSARTLATRLISAPSTSSRLSAAARSESRISPASWSIPTRSSESMR